MYATSTALAQVTSTLADVGIFLVAVIAAVLAAWAGLTGLGFLKRKVSHYVAGRKF